MTTNIKMCGNCGHRLKKIRRFGYTAESYNECELTGEIVDQNDLACEKWIPKKAGV